MKSSLLALALANMVSAAALVVSTAAGGPLKPTRTPPAQENSPAKGDWATSNRIDFAHDVQPILRRHCYRCHGSRNQEARLRLDRRATSFGTTESEEPIIVKGRPRESLLIKRLTDASCGDLMPLDGNLLSQREIDQLRAWIEQGAAWPDALAEAPHWAHQPIRRPEVPQVADPRRTCSPIDHFVLRRLEEEGMKPSAPAARAPLLRRVTLALTGVPPTPAEVRAFITDPGADAYENVVDRLLASPRYGERWAAPWLDLARYADSNGFQADQLRDNWAFRDWVIRAFNADMPFDQFVVDQIAGDLRPNATIDQKIATGFHRMTPCNVEAGVHPEANRVNQIVDRVNTTATVFLGTTMECAQCHDHKYDPFTQKDYYRLFAYFNNTPLEVKKTSGVTWDFYGPTMKLPQDDASRNRRKVLRKQLADLKRQLDAFDPSDPQRKVLDQQIAQTRQQLDQLKPDTTLVMVELEQPRETFVLTRGDYEQPAEKVSPGTPKSLPKGFDGDKTGDRLELARWLTSPDNPLLARVTVNRWWGELFGIGIVNTPEDLGTQAEDPSHPQLLDWLAIELIESNWSMKRLHKLMVMSATYRQSASMSRASLETDPHNRLLSRGPRFRLSAELIRDNALAISGLLSAKMYGPPIMPYQPEGIWRSVGRNQPNWETAQDADRFCRGLYVVHKRAAPYPSFINFDAPDRGSCTVTRGRTNTPLQSLTLLNDPAYAEMALALADRILTESPRQTDEGRLQYALELALSRAGRPHEINLLIRLLHSERAALAANPQMASARATARLPGLVLRTQDEQELAAWFAIANVLLNLDETMSL